MQINEALLGGWLLIPPSPPSGLYGPSMHCAYSRLPQNVGENSSIQSSNSCQSRNWKDVVIGSDKTVSEVRPEQDDAGGIFRVVPNVGFENDAAEAVARHEHARGG